MYFLIYVFPFRKEAMSHILNDRGLHADIGITVLIERGFIKVDKSRLWFQMR